MAKVSVVMCCYNSERYIKETIDSVLNQTFSDFEFIIWNDGSTDSTEEIILSYKDDRIKYFKDENKGEGKAANLACQHVTTDYIARIDSDDLWLPTKLEVQYKYMIDHPNVVLSAFPVILIDQEGRYYKHTFPVTKTSYLNSHLKEGNSICHSSSMYRTNEYKKVGGYHGVRYFQDYLLFRMLSDYGDLVILRVPLVKYRLMPNSVAQRVFFSPYNGIISEYVKKIISDSVASPQDIAIFNSIYNMIPKMSSNELNTYGIGIKDRIFMAFSKILGEKYAYQIMLSLVNCIEA